MAMSDGAAKASNYVPGEISFESRVDATFDVMSRRSGFSRDPKNTVEIVA